MSSEAPAPRWRVQPEHLELAREVVAAHALRTPLVPLVQLGPTLWAKLESEQRTGSFKLRGALARVAALRREGVREVVTASAGNHGQGVGLAGRLLGLRASVFVPRSAPVTKKRAIAAHGARLHEVEGGYDAAEAAARSHAARQGLPFVSPFDDPWVAAGNGGTVGLEILEQLPGVAQVVVPVGGGGLAVGLAAALAHRARREVALLGVQSEACPAMARSLRQGRPIERLEASEPTLAEGLEGGVSATTWALAREAGLRVETVSERAIAAAVAFAWRRLGWRLEGSAAVTLAWALRAGAPRKTTVLVLTGRNLDEERLRQVLDAVPVGTEAPSTPR